MKKNVIVGVTGGIACYKAVEIVNQLNKDGYNVTVVMTANAQKFVCPLTFQTMSGNPVVVDTFDINNQIPTIHIDLAKSADLCLVVPASANFIGKVASGIADDILTTTILAITSPVIIAPAMNTNMYQNKIVQDNIGKLKKFGYKVLDTDSGRLACGDIGSGKLLPWEIIVEIAKEYLK
ncbi:MAG: flavoprotein [Bacteroidales bacterium]|jgi:phosphopantothenoylcysteine decarboxylase/phosphopantothenate--cysteine ligase